MHKLFVWKLLHALPYALYEDIENNKEIALTEYS